MTKRVFVLTDDKIRAAKTTDARYAIYDPVCPGLAIRVEPSGRKTFVLGTRHRDQFVRLRLGAFGTLSLNEARDKARLWVGLLAKGIDPRRQEAVEAGDTFAAVAEDYIKRHLKGKRTADVVSREIRTELVSVWGHRPIADITRRDVRELMEKIKDRGTTGAHARNVFNYARGIFNFACKRDHLETSPCDRLKPRDVIGAKVQRTRVLDDNELRALWKDAETLSYPLGLATQMLLLTGARMSECTEARWTEFDLKEKLWTVPQERYKADAQHLVPLSTQVVTLLKSDAFKRWPKSDLVFSRDGQRSLVFTDKHKNRVDERLTFTAPWVWHDIRRTVRTRLSGLRVPDHVAELVIGHSRKGIQRVYDQHKYLDEMREALQAWANRLASIVDPPPENVVPMRRRGRK